MTLFTSRLAWFLAALYLAGAAWIVRDELRHTYGGWINLRGMGTAIATAPSQATFGVLLKKLGVPQVNFDNPGVSGYSQILLHVLVTAALVYLLGWGLEWGFRRLFHAQP
jgi:hypothetical protein